MVDTDKEEKPSSGHEVIPVMVRSEKYVSLYSNQAEVGFSAWDIQISFMQVHGRASDVVGEEIGSVTMSPQHAKALVIPFLNTIIQYEKKHGVVQIPGQPEPISLSDMLINAYEKFKEKEEVKEEVEGSKAEPEKTKTEDSGAVPK